MTRNSIRIDGLTEKQDEHSGTFVTEYLKDNLSLDIQPGDILSAERMGIQKTDTVKPKKYLGEILKLLEKENFVQEKNFSKNSKT